MSQKVFILLFFACIFLDHAGEDSTLCSRHHSSSFDNSNQMPLTAEWDFLAGRKESKKLY